MSLTTVPTRHQSHCHTQYIPINSPRLSHSPIVKHNISLSTVPNLHTVPLAHTIYPYQQFLSVTQSQSHTQYIPINSPYPSHSPTVTHNVCLSTVPIRHRVQLSLTIYPYQQSLFVTPSHCHTQYIHINSHPSHSPTLTHNISLSTVPTRHKVPISHTICPYQQSLSVTQSHPHTQYIPIKISSPSHSPIVTQNITLSTVPIRHTVPLSHTI